MKTALIIVFSVLGGLIILLSILKRIMQHTREKLGKALKEKFSGQTIILQSRHANFFGQRSGGQKQVRGNGALVLTTKELFFLLAHPKREFTIPLKDITAVTFPKSHLGKSMMRPLLLVEYLNDSVADGLAWFVPHHEEWKKAIETAADKPV